MSPDFPSAEIFEQLTIAEDARPMHLLDRTMYAATLTPAMAKRLLSVRPEWQRKAEPQRIKQYARDMVNGDFGMSMMRFSYLIDGRIVQDDGQHRTMALASCPTETTLRTFIELMKFGEGTEFETMDRGKARRFADTLQRRGLERPAAMAAVVHPLVTWATVGSVGAVPGVTGFYRGPGQMAELFSVIQDHLGEALLLDASRRCDVLCRTWIGTRPAAILTSIALTFLSDPAAAEEFFDKVASASCPSSAKAHGGEPHLSFVFAANANRSAPSGKRVSKFALAAWYLQAFDDFVKGKSRSIFRGYSTVSFDTLHDPTGAVAKLVAELCSVQ